MKIKERLNTLRNELEVGQKMMAELETKQTKLRDTLLRITGAIQVLEELLEEQDSASNVSDTAGYEIENTSKSLHSGHLEKRVSPTAD